VYFDQSEVGKNAQDGQKLETSCVVQPETTSLGYTDIGPCISEYRRVSSDRDSYLCNPFRRDYIDNFGIIENDCDDHNCDTSCAVAPEIEHNGDANAGPHISTTYRDSSKRDTCARSPSKRLNVDTLVASLETLNNGDAKAGSHISVTYRDLSKQETWARNPSERMNVDTLVTAPETLHNGDANTGTRISATYRASSKHNTGARSPSKWQNVNILVAAPETLHNDNDDNGPHISVKYHDVSDQDTWTRISSEWQNVNTLVAAPKTLYNGDADVDPHISVKTAIHQSVIHGCVVLLSGKITLPWLLHVFSWNVILLENH